MAARPLSKFYMSIMAVLFVGGAASAQECGDVKTPCVIDSGTYHLAVPASDVVKGVIVHLHGGGGRGQGLLKSGIARLASERGYIFVAPNGYHPDFRFPNNWSVRANAHSFERDDVTFLTEVLADVRERYDTNDAPVLLSGFSRGGSMVWDVACQMPDYATAYAPIAGAFWDDLPTKCAGPVNLFHTHGWNDRTVPLEGRSLWDGSVVQGDVWASLKVLRETNGCDKRQPERNSFEGDYWFRHWTDCDAGQIQLMLHKGGHGSPKGWSVRIVDWFEALTAS